MLSSASLLLALKSGCLNSQACGLDQSMRREHGNAGTYSYPVRRLSVLLVVVAHLVKVILIKLSHEACEIAVLEVLREYVLGKFFVLRYR
jgi:hypothetical protein